MKKLLKSELKARPANVVPFRKPNPAVEQAEAALLEAAVTYCEVACGGCDLASRWRKGRDTG